MVSIVIPIYNNWVEAERTFWGICSQNFVHQIEVVLVDDGGAKNDRSLCQIQKMAENNDIELKYFWHQDRGYRLSTCRNIGISLSNYNYIIILDADVISSPDLVEFYFDALISQKASVFYGPVKYVNLDGQFVLSYAYLDSLESYASESNYRKKRDRRIKFINGKSDIEYPYNYFHGGNVALTKEIFRFVGVFDVAFNQNWGYEDIDWAYRAHKKGITIQFIPNCRGYHQESGGLTMEDRLLQKCVNKKKLLSKHPMIQLTK